MLRTTIALAFLTVMACGSNPKPINTDNPPTGEMPLPGERPVPGTTRESSITDGDGHEKLVMAKDPPITLIAGDGTKCKINERRYRRIRVGDSYSCNWR